MIVQDRRGRQAPKLGVAEGSLRKRLRPCLPLSPTEQRVGDDDEIIDRELQGRPDTADAGPNLWRSRARIER